LLMSRVICGITMSIDGFVAGANPSEQNPFGDVPPVLLHRWMFDEPEKHAAELAELSSVAGAYIMGRNMYGPAGDEYDRSWKGWWGDDPPYHTPVFVLTHRARAPIPMEGGTTFTFVTDGVRSALRQAEEAAGDKPISIGGGPNVINQFLTAQLIDELWLHIVPVTIGKGPRLFENVPNLRLEPISWGGTSRVTHIKYRVIKD
jgi:dihydrofolate reductase